jgi:hypothetical protein
LPPLESVKDMVPDAVHCWLEPSAMTVGNAAAVAESAYPEHEAAPPPEAREAVQMVAPDDPSWVPMINGLKALSHVEGPAGEKV